MVTPTGVSAFKVMFREPKRLFGGPEAVRTVAVDAANNIGVGAQSYKRGVAEYEATAVLKNADMTDAQREAVAKLRTQVGADFTGDSMIANGLDKAFAKHWDAGVEVQSVEGYVRSHKTAASHPAAQGAKELSYQVIPTNPKNSSDHRIEGFFTRVFDLNFG